MIGTRHQILMTLQRNGRETVDSLAHALNLAPATIRRHMDILQRDHLVAFQEVRRPTGRPEYSFFLTEAGQEEMPKNYGKLLKSVLQEVRSLKREDVAGQNGAGLVEIILSRIAQRIADRAALPTDDPAQRAAALAALLEEEQFTPLVQERDGKIHVELFNCPFRSVALEHKFLCAFDSHVLSQVLHTPVSMERCVAWGDTSCSYVTSEPQ